MDVTVAFDATHGKHMSRLKGVLICLSVLVIFAIWFGIRDYRYLEKEKNVSIPNACSPHTPRPSFERIYAQSREDHHVFTYGPLKFRITVPGDEWRFAENIVPDEEEQIQFPSVYYSLQITTGKNSSNFYVSTDNCVSVETWSSLLPTAWNKRNIVDIHGVPWGYSAMVIGKETREKYFTHAHGFHYEFEGIDILPMVRGFQITK